jgi:hypothetical protein
VLDEAFVLESWLDVELAVLDEYIFVGDGSLFELAIAEATYLSSFCPNLIVDAAREVIKEYGAIRVRDYGAEAVPNEESGKTESNE